MTKINKLKKFISIALKVFATPGINLNFFKIKKNNN
jgi:hypothetical protein